MRLRMWTSALCCAAVLTGYGAPPSPERPSMGEMPHAEETSAVRDMPPGRTDTTQLHWTAPPAEEPLADYTETQHAGFQQAEKALVSYTSPNQRFTFSFGGSLIVRGSYDFKGVVNSIDFIPYEIPVPGNYATRQKISMDASTSHIIMKAVARSPKLGPVTITIDADFRGGAELVGRLGKFKCVFKFPLPDRILSVRITVFLLTRRIKLHQILRHLAGCFPNL